MRKDIVRYAFFTLVCILVLAMVYPTLYRYDKYNQKIPVRINRITGVAEFLHTNGWSRDADEFPKKSEMQMFQERMDLELDLVKGEIEKELVGKFKEEITARINDKLVQVEKEIGAYKAAQLDPNNSFSIGSTKEQVKRIMGVPDATDAYFDSWDYGNSRIKFEHNKVISWDNGDKNLKLK